MEKGLNPLGFGPPERRDEQKKDLWQNRQSDEFKLSKAEETQDSFESNQLNLEQYADPFRAAPRTAFERLEKKLQAKIEAPQVLADPNGSLWIKLSASFMQNAKKNGKSLVLHATEQAEIVFVPKKEK